MFYEPHIGIFETECHLCNMSLCFDLKIQIWQLMLFFSKSIVENTWSLRIKCDNTLNVCCRTELFFRKLNYYYCKFSKMRKISFYLSLSARQAKIRDSHGSTINFFVVKNKNRKLKYEKKNYQYLDDEWVDRQDKRRYLLAQLDLKNK